MIIKKSPEEIDKMAAGPLNILERLAGGSLYHCCFCRIQFYDRRKMAPRVNVQPVPGEPPVRVPVEGRAGQAVA